MSNKAAVQRYRPTVGYVHCPGVALCFQLATGPMFACERLRAAALTRGLAGRSIQLARRAHHFLYMLASGMCSIGTGGVSVVSGSEAEGRTWKQLHARCRQENSQSVIEPSHLIWVYSAERRRAKGREEDHSGTMSASHRKGFPRKCWYWIHRVPWANVG